MFFIKRIVLMLLLESLIFVALISCDIETKNYEAVCMSDSEEQDQIDSKDVIGIEFKSLRNDINLKNLRANNKKVDYGSERIVKNTISEGFQFPLCFPDDLNCECKIGGSQCHEDTGFGGTCDDCGKDNLDLLGHTGEDYNIGSKNFDCYAPVYAVANGRVVFNEYLSKWGNTIIIQHELGNNYNIFSFYSHLYDTNVQVEDEVIKGNKIATVGDGDSNGSNICGDSRPWNAHLHFEIWPMEKHSSAGKGYAGYTFKYISGFVKPYNILKGYKSSDHYYIGWFENGWQYKISDIFLQKFIDLKNNNCDIGVPFNNEGHSKYVHNVDGVILQDYYKSGVISPTDCVGSDGSSALIYNNKDDNISEQVYHLKKGFWGAYKCISVGGENMKGPMLLGAPLSDEYTDTIGKDCGKCKSHSPSNATVQKFENGCMWFNPPDNDDIIHVHLCNDSAEFDNSMAPGCEKVDIKKNPGTETCPNDKCLNMGCSQHRDPFNDELFKTPATGSSVWYARGDYKHAFPTSECYHLFYDDFSGLSCIANANAEELTTGLQVCSEGSFVRRLDSATIYRFESGKMRALCGSWTSASFQSRWGYPFDVAVLLDPSKWNGLTAVYPIDYGRGIYPAGQQAPKCGDPGYECGTFTDSVGGVCHAQLNCGTCPECGDSICDTSHGETCSSCLTDCGSCVTCGDNICSSSDGENCSTCAQDCGICNYLVAGEITSPANGATVSNEEFSINWTNGYSEVFSTETALYCQKDSGTWAWASGFEQVPPVNYHPSAPGQNIACKVRTRMKNDYTTFVDSPVVTWHTSSSYPNIVVQSAHILPSPLPNGCNDIYIDATFKNVGDQAGTWKAFAYLHPTGEDETSDSAIKARWDIPLEAVSGETITKTFRINNEFALPIASNDWSVTVISDDFYNNYGSSSRITIPAYGDDSEFPAITLFRVNGYLTTPIEVLPGSKYSVNISVSDNYALSSWKLRWRESSDGSWETIDEKTFSLSGCYTHFFDSIYWTVPSTLSAGQLMDVNLLITDTSGKTKEQTIQVKTRSNAEPAVNFIKPGGGEKYPAKTPYNSSCVPVEFYFIPGVEITQMQLGFSNLTHSEHEYDYNNGQISPIPNDGHVERCLDAGDSGDEIVVFVRIRDVNGINHFFYSEPITVDLPASRAPWKNIVLEETQHELPPPDTTHQWLYLDSYGGLKVIDDTVSVYRSDSRCSGSYLYDEFHLSLSILYFNLSDMAHISTTTLLNDYSENSGCNDDFDLQPLMQPYPYTDIILGAYSIKDESSCVMDSGQELCDYDLYFREVTSGTISAPMLVNRYEARLSYDNPTLRTAISTGVGEKFVYIYNTISDSAVYKADVYKSTTGIYNMLGDMNPIPRAIYSTTQGIFGIESVPDNGRSRLQSYYMDKTDSSLTNIMPIFSYDNSNTASGFYKNPYNDNVHLFVYDSNNRILTYGVYANYIWLNYPPVSISDKWRGKQIQKIYFRGIISNDTKTYLLGEIILTENTSISYKFIVPFEPNKAIEIDNAFWDFSEYALEAKDITNQKVTILPDGRLLRLRYCVWNMEQRLCFQESYLTEEDCYDGDSCTDDIWNSSIGICTHEMKQCPDDGNICNGLEVCDPASGECVSDEISSINCDDGNKCNGEETCDPEFGTCISGSPIEVVDAFVCTEDKCDELTGEVAHVVSNDLCYTEPCFMTQCAPGNPLADENTGCIVLEKPISSDGLDCTEDSCNEITGMPQYDVDPENCVIEGACIQNGINKGDNICVVCDSSVDSYDWTPVADSTSCNDNLSCTESDKCIDGVCVGSQIYCASETLASTCSSYQCSELTGSCETLVQGDGAPCNDFTVCNGAETCQDGLCLSGPALECNDQNACTVDSCDDLEGCKHATLPDGSVCDEAKTGLQRCFSGNCLDEKSGQTCETAKELTLGIQYIAHFDGRFDLIQEYTCTDLSFTGPEIYFSILLNKGTYIITVTPGEGTDPSIFILNSCEEQNCNSSAMETETGKSEERTINIEEDGSTLIFAVDFTTYLVSDSIAVVVNAIEIQDEDIVDQDMDLQEEDIYDQDIYDQDDLDEDSGFIHQNDKDADEEDENILNDKESPSGCNCALVY